MKATAIAFGWSLAGIFAVLVAGDTGARVAELELAYPAMVEEARK